METRSEEQVQLGLTWARNGKSETKTISPAFSPQFPQLIFLIIHCGRESTDSHPLLCVIKQWDWQKSHSLFWKERFVESNKSAKAGQSTSLASKQKQQAASEVSVSSWPKWLFPRIWMIHGFTHLTWVQMDRAW